VGRTNALLAKTKLLSFLKEHNESDAYDDASLQAIYDIGISVVSAFATPKSPDNVEGVIAAVNRLMSENATEEYFSVGQLIGRTSATIERWQPLLYKGPCIEYLPDVEYRNGKRLWSFREAAELEEDYHTNIRSVLRARLVRESTQAAAILGAEASRSVVGRNWEACAPGEESLELRGLLCLGGAQKAVWFALGTLLGTLRDVDDAAQERDRRSLTPRPYLLSSRASPEQIAGLIRMVEQTFGDLGDKGLQPEYVVNCLANAIEGLAKKLWPKDFDQGGRRGELRNVLQAHFATGSEAERRFARLALTLYDVYRKPVIHELGAFKCTWDEARFFHAGIRTLHTLSEEIHQSGSGDRHET
jgi:hypothetical protein